MPQDRTVRDIAHAAEQLEIIAIAWQYESGQRSQIARTVSRDPVHDDPVVRFVVPPVESPTLVFRVDCPPPPSATFVVPPVAAPMPPEFVSLMATAEPPQPVRTNQPQIPILKTVVCDMLRTSVVLNSTAHAAGEYRANDATRCPHGTVGTASGMCHCAKPAE